MSQPYKYGRRRFWEMFPGLLVWGTFLIAIVLSFVKPLWVVVFIIVFDFLWLLRVTYFNVFVLIAWRRLKRTAATDWQARIQDLEGSQRVYHVVMLPTYKEPYEIIRVTLRSLAEAKIDHSRMIVVLGGEEGDKQAFQGHVVRARKEFDGRFAKLMHTVHPRGLQGEIPGKGSNLNWMGHRVEEMLNEEFPQVADEDIVVSAFDVDTIAHQQYFAYLTHLYCTVEHPTRTSYQPIALFSNNIWTASAPVRIGAFGTTFWLFGELTRPERLWTFSSHSMPWKMLKDVGFWQTDIVSEDSRIFMQAFLRYKGDYRVTPMFLPVSMDAVTGARYMDALRALYVQMRRWAWGVEHLPYMIDGFARVKGIPWRKRAQYVFNHIEGMWTWATAPVIMFVLGWLPLWVAGGRGEALIQAAPFTLQNLMQLAMIGILISALVALTLLPHRPEQVKKRTWGVMLLQWALLPVTFIVFGSIPAIDAQTRLMVGRYLGFNVTRKGR